MGPRPDQPCRAPTALPPSGPEIASLLRPGAAVGRWRLIERMGATAFAGVDADTGDAVVVKAASDEELAREVDALAAVQHPHLVRLVGRERGVVVTARVLGPSLAHRLAEQ